MKILLSSNKQIIKRFLEENSKIGFIPTASELDSDRWYMEKDKKDLIEMRYNITNIEITSEEKEEILKNWIALMLYLLLVETAFIYCNN